MIDFNSLLPTVGSFIGGAVSAGAVSGPIKSLNDWWYYHFGKNTELRRTEAQLLNESKIEAYKKDIFDEVKKIPAENIKQPQLDIIGPALEASKYYIDAPALRKMFSKLVASSMDSSKEQITRSVFVDFVKQMNPFDAKLLAIFSNEVGPNIPIATIQQKFNDNEGILTFKSGVLTMNLLDNLNDRKMASSSIINLSRMGLVDTSYSEWLTKFDYDESFSKTPEYFQCGQQIESAKSEYQERLNTEVTISSEYMNTLKKKADSTVTIGKGRLMITTLGKEFTEICI